MPGETNERKKEDKAECEHKWKAEELTEHKFTSSLFAQNAEQKRRQNFSLEG